MSAVSWPSHIWLAGWIGESRSVTVFSMAHSSPQTSNLMARDEFKNLGFQDAAEDKTPEREKGVKGELQW